MHAIRSFAAVLAVAALCAPAAAQVAGAPLTPKATLRSAVTVDSTLVRIGDLVDNAGAVADIPIFRSPDLGETGSVPVKAVLDAIRPHHLIGVAANGLAAISVTRAAHAITRQEIESEIAAAVAHDRGIADPSTLQLQFDGEVGTVYVEPSLHDSLRIVRLFVDRRGRFDITLDAPGSEAVRPMRLTGQAFETILVPVVLRALAMGDIVKTSDIAWERRAKSGLAADAAVNRDQIEGMAARRPLRVGDVVRVSDMSRPALVQRDHIVTLTYQVPGILLTMRAKALENGSLGDVVNVLNTQSNRTLQATVTGVGQVTIAPPGLDSAPGPSAMNTTAAPLSRAE